MYTVCISVFSYIYIFGYIFGYIYISIGSLGIQKNKNYNLSVDCKKTAPGDYQTFTFSRLHNYPFWNLVMWNSSSTGRLLCRILFECWLCFFQVFLHQLDEKWEDFTRKMKALGSFCRGNWSSLGIEICPQNHWKPGSPQKWMQQENNQNICSVPFHRQFSAIATSLPCHYLT